MGNPKAASHHMHFGSSKWRTRLGAWKWRCLPQHSKFLSSTIICGFQPIRHCLSKIKFRHWITVRIQTTNLSLNPVCLWFFSRPTSLMCFLRRHLSLGAFSRQLLLNWLGQLPFFCQLPLGVRTWGPFNLHFRVKLNLKLNLKSSTCSTVVWTTVDLQFNSNWYLSPPPVSIL
jgi:hypothetical protein